MKGKLKIDNNDIGIYKRVIHEQERLLNILKKHLVITENYKGQQYIVISANGKCPSDHYLYFGEMNNCKKDFKEIKQWLLK